MLSAIPAPVGPMDAPHQAPVGRGDRPDTSLPATSIHQTGLVHCHVRSRNLPPESVYCVPHTEDRSGFGSGWYGLDLLTPREKISLIMFFPFVDDQGPELPTKANEEFRPFIRRLPEFKFWYAISKSTVIGIICTFFEVFNVPVFWPILVMYFITLFCITMKRQIRVSCLQET